MAPILPGAAPSENNGGMARAGRLRPPLWAVAVGLGYAALGATFPSHGIASLIAVLVPGVAALAAALAAVALNRRTVDGGSQPSEQPPPVPGGVPPCQRIGFWELTRGSVRSVDNFGVRTAPGDRARFGRRYRAWLVWAFAFTVWEVASLVLGELSFSLLLDPVLAVYPLRVGGWVLWLAGLWLLVRR
jgi:putative Mn2+ efflux pump MntP